MASAVKKLEGADWDLDLEINQLHLFDPNLIDIHEGEDDEDED